jgi:hypothetical protein
LKKWLAEKPGSKIEARRCGAQAMESQDVQAMEEVVTMWSEKRVKPAVRRLEVEPQFLYKVIFWDKIHSLE